MNKLWYKGKDVLKEVEDYLASDISFDQALVRYECIASIAHAKMLDKIGILNKNELDRLVKCLNEIIELDKKGRFILTKSDEDVHTKVENYLTEKLGDTGKKIHTYRSRNDQVLVDTRLYNKDKLNELMDEVVCLCKSLLDLSKKHEFTAMPGYTHRQKAMLSSIGLWSSAFIESLLDDLRLVKTSYKLNDQCPLGSAASYGVPKNIDREYTAKLLGFEKVQNNSLYCQNSRGKIEAAILSALSQVMITLGRISADLILFSTQEFGYFKLGDEVSTGSSIMPQKRNPDVPELIKGNVNVVLGYETIVKNAIKDLPSGYNKETQVVKEHTMKALDLTIDSVKMMNLCISTLKVNEEICKKACTPELFAADYAYSLVEKGIPFREAYKKAAKEIDKIKVPDLVDVLKKRNHIGGTGNLGLDRLGKGIEEISGKL
ncbi:argininosuccinate lyase [Candidatus Woesearchaeota archaeon]|nr:argininosuccinate lyase [Candidatus Woesearchaeota archaeon]